MQPSLMPFSDVERERAAGLDSLYEVCAVPDLNDFLDSYSMEPSKLTTILSAHQPGLPQPPSTSAVTNATSSPFMNGKSHMAHGSIDMELE